MAVLALSLESARLRAPLARRILITDEATRVPPEVGVDEVKRYALDRTRHRHSSTMRVQELYLRGREAGRASVLADFRRAWSSRTPTPGDLLHPISTTRPRPARSKFPDAPFGNAGMIFVARATQGDEFLVDALPAPAEALRRSRHLGGIPRRRSKPWWGDGVRART